MDLVNIKSWISEPDVCRCCLSTSGLWNLVDAYVNPEGFTEVFSNLLQECFGLNLSLLTKWGPSRMICTLCVGRLRNANNFRKEVVEAERLFIDYYNSKGIDDSLPDVKDIKSEMEIEDYTSLDYAAPGCDDSEETCNLSIEQLKVMPKEPSLRRQRRRIKKSKKPKTKKKQRNNGTREDGLESESDTPIAELKAISEEHGRNIINLSAGLEKKLPQTKPLSESKRLILTSGIVLKNTNACPFRHHKSWFQCFFCIKEFMEINLLRDHMGENHKDIENELKKLKRYPRSLQIDISTLKCIPCEKILTDINAMKDHFMEVHKKIIYNECIADYKVNKSPYICHLCDQEFHVFRSLTTHINEHYANCICDVCGKSFINSKRLKVHKRTHEKGSFPCNECGKILKTKTSKANHMESAHSKRILKCHICSEPMKHYNDRIKHMSEVHNITHSFKCPICSREYNIKHYLATHMRQTHGHKNKKCSECGMAFITNHGLKKHMLKHTGEKSFVCQICCKSYARNYTLKEHLRTHESDGRFLCPE